MRSLRSTAFVLGWLLCVAATACFCEHFLRGADAALYNFFARSPQTKVVLLFPGEKLPTQRVLLPHHSSVYPTVYSILWDDTTNSGSPDDTSLLRELSTILHCLATQRPVQIIGISAVPRWADASDPTVRSMLHHSLEKIHHLRLGLQAMDSAQYQPIPDDILSLAIPQENIEGNISSLPTANTCSSFDNPPRGEQNPFKLSPDYVRNELLSHEMALERGLSLPLLVHWNDHLFPTLPLQLAIDALGLTPKDLKVHPGRSLQIGQRILPLDLTGRSPLGSARAEILPLSAALSSPQDADSASCGEDSLPRCAIITRPNTATMAARDRGPQLAATLSLLLARERVNYLSEERPIAAQALRVNPLQHEPLGLFALAMSCLTALLLLPRLPGELPWLLRSTLLFAGFIGISILAVLWYRQGLWMSLCAWFLCWLELLFAQETLRHLRSSKDCTQGSNACL